jgi:hypothetical protein
VTFEFDGGVQKWLHNNMTVVEVRQEFKLCSLGPDGTADSAEECSDASGSESAALPESVVAPEFEVCGGSTSAAQVVVVKPARTWKAESHGRWSSESSGSSSSSCSSSANLLPAAHKRRTTLGEASASGRTVQSGSGSSRLPFAQPPAVAGGIAGSIAGGSLLALGLAALRAGVRTVEVVSIAAEDIIVTSTVAVTDLIEAGALAVCQALH